ncbi:MAG TPA: DUF1553 domain-containing protein, partial [Chthonomonadales bacterium]|nr:DUF1553 domain-containing protein [Chthonomonadales bacterium]
AGLKIYINGLAVPVRTVRDRLKKGIGSSTLVFGERFRDRGFKSGQIGDIAIFQRAITPIEVAQLNDGRSLTTALAQPGQHVEVLRSYYLSALDSPCRTARAVLETARKEIVDSENAQFEVAVMQEMSHPRPTYCLARGRYDAKVTAADLVGRTTPASLIPWPAGVRRDRLGLAKWLMLPNHPLTARVEVNRLWSQMFGTGLVLTPEDFGTQGKPPTHPRLLDWLARRFIQSGWNIKAMLKLIALSSTYRQSSRQRPDLRARDPENELLARGPSFRLSAEEIRDTALAASGLLNGAVGGAPVSPYQPGDLWTESNSMSPAYDQSVGTGLYRRSIYTVWKRTAPMPNMIAFDAGTREVCLARRDVTNTPTQALVLLDDTQFVEAARVLGERMLKEGGADDSNQIDFAFRLLTGRRPDSVELRLLKDLYSSQRTLYKADPAAAAKLAAIGEKKVDPRLNPADVAAAAIVAQTIMNMDASVWNR